MSIAVQTKHKKSTKGGNFRFVNPVPSKVEFAIFESPSALEGIVSISTPTPRAPSVPSFSLVPFFSLAPSLFPNLALADSLPGSDLWSPFPLFSSSC